MQPDFDVAIVGAGVVGLSCALACAEAGLSTVLIEQNAKPGQETSSRNSSVVHSGLYYATDSLKAQMTCSGNVALYTYCERFNVPYRKCGKIVVATSNMQISQLERLMKRGKENGVAGLQFLDKGDVKRLENEITATSGLYVPSTGIIDSNRFIWSLLARAEECHVTFAPVTRVHNIRIEDGYADIYTGEQESVRVRTWVNAAGHSALGLYASVFSEPRYHAGRFACGNYFAVIGAQKLFNHLIYPLPDESGLGIHITLDFDGNIRLGPDVEWKENFDLNVDETLNAKFVQAVSRYWPGITNYKIAPDYAGIRPKVFNPDGSAVKDFIIEEDKQQPSRGLHLLGIESPGLTASLMLADCIKGKIRKMLELYA